MARAILLGEWTYTIEAAVGSVLALVAIIDGWRNLLVVRRGGNGRQAAAWLWIGLAVVALTEQAKQAVLGLVVVLGPQSPEAASRPSTIPIIVGFVVTTAAVLGIQVAMIVGRAALRRHPPHSLADPPHGGLR